jgi:hemolysin-activating ACP:hemolysin acyltransferase
MSSYSWRIATQEDFHKVYSLIVNSPDAPHWNLEQVRRRVNIPLFLEQLIIFEKSNKACGFLTYALMDGQSACHQSTVGTLPADWRSGDQLWVVDFLAHGGDGAKMFSKLKEDLRDALQGPVRFFRLKHKRVRRASVINVEQKS